MGTIRSTAANRHCEVSAQITAHLDAVDRDDRDQEFIDELVDNWLNDPAECIAADTHTNGCMGDDVYEQTHYALAELGSIDWQAIVAGNWSARAYFALHRVHSIAQRYYDARKDELTERAVAELEKQRKDADEAETEIRMMLAECAP